MNIVRALTAALLLTLLGACATPVPEDYPRTPSAALQDTGDTELGRVDHRMHNESFTVDNPVTVVGGRNIGDEYFDANSQFEFADLDVAGFGPIAQEVSSAFDTCWNSAFAMPAAALVESTTDPDAIAKLRQSYAPRLGEESSAGYRAAMDSTILDNLLDPSFPLFWGRAMVIFDDPAKMAEWAAGKFAERLDKHAFRVVLNKSGALEWIDASSTNDLVY